MTRPPVWRDIRVLRVVGQVVFVVVVVFVLREMYLNATYNLDQRGRELSFAFLDNRAGFGIKESVLSYHPNNPYQRALVVAYTNALTVGLTGIVLATVLGLIIGVARLSPNWLIRKIAQVYVEIFRNTPALVQIIFWWAAVILAIPRIENSLSVFGIAFVSNRGAAIPAIRGGEDGGAWGLFLLAGIVIGVILWRWRTRVNEATGAPSYRWSYAFGAFLGIAVLGYLLLGDAFFVDVPEIGERVRSYSGGLQMSPEFAGVLLGLVVYTSAFIGEIVRGSILAVSKGQKEAAQALGLRPGQQLRLVVLPQAMRIAIPPINNQYLNLWKNTSLAFAIGYPDLINVSTTIINQAGNELQVHAIVVAFYLVTCLLISALMNLVNRGFAFKGATRE